MLKKTGFLLLIVAALLMVGCKQVEQTARQDGRAIAQESSKLTHEADTEVSWWMHDLAFWHRAKERMEILEKAEAKWPQLDEVMIYLGKTHVQEKKD